MSFSNKTYKELAIPYFSEVFQLIDKVLTEQNIPYYLIGVTAVALELLKDGIKPSRGTKDIDFAIMIASLQQFDKVVTELEKQGFNKVNAPWTLYHPTFKVAVDLLPFGEIEENHTVNFNKRFTDLHVLGFKEVMEEAKPIEIEEKIAFIPPLYGMVILKLVAWSDRPEERNNDLFDILLIISKYFSLEYDEIMSNHFDTFPEQELDQLKIAARVLGRKASIILNKSDKLKNRIIDVLNKNTLNPELSSIALQWASKNDWTVEYAVDLLNELKLGIQE